MAAHCWRLLLVFELGIAIASTVLLSVACNASVALLALTCFGVLLLLPGALVGISFVVGRIMGPAQVGRIELLRAWVSESVALWRVSVAMSLEPWRGFKYGSPPDRAPQPVLLIHGIVCNRGVWRPLAGALREHGFGPVRAVNLEPLLGNIDSHAAYVADVIRQLRRDCGGARVAIIAHSMGGLVARAALQKLGPDDISQMVTVGSPHHGTLLARLLPGLPRRQMRPDSAWLTALNALQEGRFPVPITCIYSANDNLVRPAWSAVLEGASQFELRGLGHLSLLSARRGIDCTLSALTGSRAGREPCLT